MPVDDDIDYIARSTATRTQPPSWFPGGHLPPDARRMGLSHHVPEGALLDFAGKLDATKPWHRISAWALLVVFGLPVVFAVLRLFDAMAG